MLLPELQVKPIRSVAVRGCMFQILHVTLNFAKFSFKYQMYLMSSVLCLLFALENEDLRFEYLVFKELYVFSPCRNYILCSYWAAVPKLVYWVMKKHGHEIDLE